MLLDQLYRQIVMDHITVNWNNLKPSDCLIKTPLVEIP